jgi:16S rRNA (uracil1498-N3)-methyltransferase
MMKKTMNNKSHEFALHSKEFSQAIVEKKTQVTLTDITVIHRLQHVLRAGKGEVVMLFDDLFHAPCTIVNYTKNKALLSIGALTKNVPVAPELTVIMPLLKREALDELVYACRELGVSGVYFVSTDKSSRHSLSISERERLERVSIAAAEQSKNFSPCLFLNEFKFQGGKDSPLPTVTEVLETQKNTSAFTDALKLYADPEGILWQHIISTTPTEGKNFMICVGPEGDMSDREKALLQLHGFTFCQLGSTILRAQQAATLLIGIVRTCR